MLTLLHLSDLHFGPPYLPEVGDAVLEFVPHLRPDVIVLSGDFTQRATREQFAEARAFIDRLPDVPKVVCPGNHDVPLYRVKERVLSPLALYQEYITNELNHVVEIDGAVIVSLDSTAPYSSIVNGRITKEQLDFATQAFTRSPASAAKIVVAHHHFSPAPDYERNPTMPQSKRAMNRFIALGVDLILGGHLHRAYIGNSLDIYPGPNRDHGVIVVQCGTTTSRRGRAREREKNSFNLIKITGDMLRVTHYMYFHDIHGFAPFSRHIFPRPGKRFMEGHLHHSDREEAPAH